jgi:hypothetical protein
MHCHNPRRDAAHAVEKRASRFQKDISNRFLDLEELTIAINGNNVLTDGDSEIINDDDTPNGEGSVAHQSAPSNKMY